MSATVDSTSAKSPMQALGFSTKQAHDLWHTFEVRRVDFLHSGCPVRPNLLPFEGDDDDDYDDDDDGDDGDGKNH